MKNWYESKTMWTALGFIALAVASYIFTKDLQKSIELVLMGLGLIGLRTGVKKIGTEDKSE